MPHLRRHRGSPSLPSVRSTALQCGAGRAGIAAVILARPVSAARLLGADGATAQRVTWLTRMMGVRDGVLGVGTISALRGDAGPSYWLLGPAVADSLDAVVIAQALRQGRLRGAVPAAVVVGAAGSAAVHAAAAFGLRHQHQG